MAWERGYRNVEVECDNSLLLNLILMEGVTDSKMLEIRLIYELLNRTQDVLIRYVPRERNMVTDRLTKTANPHLTHLVSLDTPPPSVLPLLMEDVDVSSLN